MKTDKDVWLYWNNIIPFKWLYKIPSCVHSGIVCMHVNNELDKINKLNLSLTPMELMKSSLVTICYYIWHFIKCQSIFCHRISFLCKYLFVLDLKTIYSVLFFLNNLFNAKSIQESKLWDAGLCHVYWNKIFVREQK